MERSTLLLIALTLCLPSLKSLVQTSDSLSFSESVHKGHSMIRPSSRPYDPATEELFLSESSVDGSGDGVGFKTSQPLRDESVSPKKPEGVSNENHSASGIALTTRLAHVHSGARGQEADKANTSITGHTQSDSPITPEEDLLEISHITVEKKSDELIVNNDSPTDGDRSQHPGQIKVFPSTSQENPAGLGGPCVFGIRPCAVQRNFNGTSLLWEDMKRTLTFAWDMHVFGSASLFTLIAVLATLGMVGACTRPLPHPLCDALTLANIYLIFSGSSRTILLLVDPYGTRQVLSHASLAALHNVSLSLLLWTQVILALVTLRGLRIILFPLNLQRPWVIGGLAVCHCTILFTADSYYSALTPAVPLLLHSLSICWGFPFCLEILVKSLSHLHPFRRSSMSQWAPSHRTERLGKRVTAVCAFLGVLCCSLQMYSLFWLYGLLGNWRRFSWGWWLSQFSARILELGWGFSLVVLGSWIFWTPCRSHSRGAQGQNRGEVSKGVEEQSLWGRILASMWTCPLTKSEKTWEELIPNNWEKYKMSKAGISNSAMCPYDDHSSTTLHKHKTDLVSGSAADPPAALLWQKVGERECVLSLIEFDMRPMSPIDLRRSIDNALHHGQLVNGGLFTPPPPSWTQGTNVNHEYGGASMFPPAYVGYGWMMDTESISPSLDQFQAKEPMESPSADNNGSTGSPFDPHQGEDLPAVPHQYDWSDEEITDL